MKFKVLKPEIAYHDEKSTQVKERLRKASRRRSDRKKEYRKLRREAAENLLRYESFGMEEKIAFARNNYCFPDNPCPAIIYCKTSLKTEKGMDKGVKAHKLFPYLPVGFILLFSKLQVLDEPTEDEFLKNYQAGLSGGRYLIMNPEPTEAHGMGNFVNCPLRRKQTPDDDQKWTSKKQNMKVAQCRLIRSTSNIMSEANLEEFPAYLKVVKKILPGRELLASYGSSFRV
jgi:hypothetical protein